MVTAIPESEGKIGNSENNPQAQPEKPISLPAQLDTNNSLAHRVAEILSKDSTFLKNLKLPDDFKVNSRLSSKSRRLRS